jgi:ribosomal protein S18 acetylase RimI-like enzyme
VDIAEDGWLSERFGHPVFTVRSLDGGDLSRAGTYQAKVASADVARLHRFCDAGFRVVCTSVTLRREPAPIDGGAGVRPLDPDRDAAVPDIAAEAFSLSRFHLDPNVPDEVAVRIKRDWAQAYLDGTRGDGALVVEADGQVVGFLGVVAAGDVRVIDLIAVAPSAQGRGAGGALVRRLCSDWSGPVEVGTQTANERGIRFYERLGFETARTAYDLHLHVDSP